MNYTIPELWERCKNQSNFTERAQEIAAFNRFLIISMIGPNTKINVFWVTARIILGRVGTHFFSFFLEKIQFYAFQNS